MFTHELLWVTLRIAFIGGVLSIVNGASASVVGLLYAVGLGVYRFASVIGAAASVFTMIGSVLILRLLSAAFVDWREVKKP